MIEYSNEEWIILDKSPYSEYFYQQTPSFDRGYISRYQNHLLEKEIFKYKDKIDNAIVIFLENDECWENYKNRENQKKAWGHETSYELLSEESYRQMVDSFRRCQDIYEGKKYQRIKIGNNNVDWKKVYNAIIKLSKETIDQEVEV
jgi:thymidylate kinase